MTYWWRIFFTLLPKNLLSRCFGMFSRIGFPGWILRPLLSCFARAYEIRLDEAEKPLEAYGSLNEFFTRALRPGLRPIDTGPGIVVSPVDARISGMGRMQNGRLIQAKGLSYSLQELLDHVDVASRLRGGLYIVLYLSPQDYHRVHAPYDGHITGYVYLPGRLFPVNAFAVQHIANLFAQNERLITYLETDAGLIAVVKVGAFDVGHITVTYDDMVTNRWVRRRQHKTYVPPRPIRAGDELGRFEMGSTVVLLLEDGAFEPAQDIETGKKVRLGQRLFVLQR